MTVEGARQLRRGGGEPSFKRLVVWSFVVQLILIAAAAVMGYRGTEPTWLRLIVFGAYHWTLPLLLMYADLRGWRGEGVIGFVILGLPLLAAVVALGYSLVFAWIVVRVARWRTGVGEGQRSSPGQGLAPQAE